MTPLTLLTPSQLLVVDGAVPDPSWVWRRARSLGVSAMSALVPFLRRAGNAWPCPGCLAGIELRGGEVSCVTSGPCHSSADAMPGAQTPRRMTNADNTPRAA